MTTDPTASTLRKRDRIRVNKDGKEIEVYNWVTITRDQCAIVRGSNPRVEHFDGDPEIYAGDSRRHPDAVTSWVARELWHNFQFNVEDYEAHDIDVIDPTSQEVDVL